MTERGGEAGLRYEVNLSQGLSGKYSEVARRIPPGSRILELGGASGYFARELVRLGHVVTLVDYDVANVEKARTRGLEAHRADLNQPLPDVLFAGEPYDVVVAMDVLEHLVDPAALLRDLRSHLGDGTRIIVTGPNVAYWWVRLNLLRGRWTYSDTGIMDHTHLRWFTLATWTELIGRAGFRVVTTVAAEGALPKQDWLRLIGVSEGAVAWFRDSTMRRFPRIFCSVFLFVADPR